MHELLCSTLPSCRLLIPFLPISLGRVRGTHFTLPTQTHVKYFCSSWKELTESKVLCKQGFQPDYETWGLTIGACGTIIGTAELGHCFMYQLVTYHQNLLCNLLYRHQNSLCRKSTEVVASQDTF